MTTAAVIVLGVTLLLQFREPPLPTDIPAPAASPPAEREAATAKARLMERQAAEPVRDEALSASPVVEESEAGAAATRRVEQAMPIADDADDQLPEQWLEDIRALVEAGRLEEAQASPDAFREAWPDYPVPDDLVPNDRAP